MREKREGKKYWKSKGILKTKHKKMKLKKHILYKYTSRSHAVLSIKIFIQCKPHNCPSQNAIYNTNMTACNG